MYFLSVKYKLARQHSLRVRVTTHYIIYIYIYIYCTGWCKREILQYVFTSKALGVQAYAIVTVILQLMPNETAVVQVFEKGDTFHSGTQNLINSQIPAVDVDYGTARCYNMKQVVRHF